MIEDLKTKIDNTLKTHDDNVWIMYENAKREVRDYERNQGEGFTPKEYNEYITYISDKLDI